MPGRRELYHDADRGQKPFQIRVECIENHVFRTTETAPSGALFYGLKCPITQPTINVVKMSGNQRIGYARVSTDEQNLDLQRDALERTGCTATVGSTPSLMVVFEDSC